MVNLKTFAIPGQFIDNSFVDPVMKNPRTTHPARREKTGLRVLHVGNIANNAYHIAKLLNGAGYDCDVLCSDYYHVMSCPEWEDAEFDGNVDSFRPDWSRVDLHGFERPAWFAQGPLFPAIRYLQSRRRGGNRAARYWNRVLLANQRNGNSLGDRFWSFAPLLPDRIARKKRQLIQLWKNNSPGADSKPFRSLSAEFGRLFPARAGSFLPQDLWPYQDRIAVFRDLFAAYDIVQAYGTEPIWPLLAGRRPYIALEHGTIRQIPFDNTPVGRLTALGYRAAAETIITNCDNKRAADRLGLSYRFIPHMVNERWLVSDPEAGPRLRAEFDPPADFLVFHPTRHHWEPERNPSWEKGNDIFIRGLGRVIREIDPRAAAVFVDWGKTAPKSRDLLAELGISGRVKWIPVQSNRTMARYIGAADLVADQFFLGAFGNIMPKASAMGRASMLYIDESIHRWCFAEMPPILNARTPEDVFEGLRRSIQDRAGLLGLGERARDWYRRFHSNAVILESLTALYDEVMTKG